MQIINEIIIVEGKKDSANIQRFFPVQTYETGGRNITAKMISELQALAAVFPLVIFTDPDSAGSYIRRKLAEALPAAAHAYLSAADCRKGKRLGIEYAGKAELAEALSHLFTYRKTVAGLTNADLLDLGLSGSPGASDQRNRLSRRLHLGEGNAKDLLRKLNALNIDKSRLRKVLADE